MEAYYSGLKIVSYKLKLMHHRKEKKMNEVKVYTEKMFEDIKHIDNEGNEYWFARELQTVLEYSQWRRFELNGIKNKTK